MTPPQDAAAQPEDAGKADPADDEAPAPEDQTAPAEAAAVEEPEPPATDEPADADPAAQDDLKAKYREALAHKQGSHGAAAGGHGDRGAAPHGTNNGPGQRMFRRKSG